MGGETPVIVPSAAAAEPGAFRRPAAVRLGVLGPVIVTSGGEDARPNALRQRRLLTILAAAGSRTVSAEELVDALYGEDASTRTRHSLATEIWRARQVLGPAAITNDPDGYRLDVEHCAVDVVAFERGLARGRSALRHGDHAGAEAELAGALALWRGEPLAEWRDHPTGQAVASRLHELRRGGEVDRAEALLGLHRHAEAIELLERVTDAEATREHAWALLVECCLAAGRYRHARAAFDTARRTLADYGVDVGAELQVVGRRLRTLAAEASTPAPVAADDQADDQADVFVGRDRELAAVLAAVRRAAAEPAPVLVLVTGEPGIGKSTLVDRAAARLAAGDAPPRIVRLSGDRRLTLPYAPLLPLLTRLGASTPLPAALQRLVDPPADPEAPDTAPTAWGDTSREQLETGIVEFLESAARGGPLLVVLDDAQWVTAATLHVLLQLLARRAPVPLALLVTARDLPVDGEDDRRPALRELRRRAAVALPLGGLDEAASARLLGVEVSSAAAAAAHRRTAGNPLYLSLLAGTGRGHHSLAAAVEDHLALLPVAAVTGLRFAAVAGTAFDRRVLAAAARRAAQPLDAPAADGSALEPAALDDALDAARRAGLLHEVPDSPDSLCFVHVLVRDHLYDSAPAAERRAAHAAIGATLERWAVRDSSALDLIAHHFESAWPAVPAAEAALRLRAAGDRAAGQLGFAEAARYYHRALDLLALDAAPGDPGLTAGLLESAAEAATAAAGEHAVSHPAGSLEPAREAYAALRSLAVATDRPEARLRAALGTLTTYTTERIEEPVVDELELACRGLLEGEHPPSAAGRDLLARSIGLLHSFRPARARELLERAVAADAPAAAQYLTRTWEHETVPGRLAIARRLVADPGPDPVSGWLRLWVSEVACGERSLDAAPPVLNPDVPPSPTARWELAAWRNTVAIATGRFAAARRRLDEAGRLVGTVSSSAEIASRAAALMAQNLRLALLSSPEPVRADELDIPHATWVSTHPIMVSWRAYMTAATGQRAAASAACAELVALIGDGRVPEENALPVLLGLASAAVEIADPIAVGAAREALAPHTGQHGIYYVTAYWGSVDHHLGRLALTAGDLDQAVEHLRAGALAHRGAGARPYEVQSRLARATALWRRNRAGDRDEASYDHRSATTTARELGMPRVAAAPWPPAS